MALRIYNSSWKGTIYPRQMLISCSTNWMIIKKYYAICNLNLLTMNFRGTQQHKAKGLHTSISIVMVCISIITVKILQFLKPLKLLRTKFINILRTGLGTAWSEGGSESRIHWVFQKETSNLKLTLQPISRN